MHHVCRSAVGASADYYCSVCRRMVNSPHLCTDDEVELADDYASLRRVLDLALRQAADGKGAERHANGKPFTEQPMLEISRMVGWQFCLGQAIKKTQEASRMEADAAKRELLGAINYLAGAYLTLEETKTT